MKVWVCLAGEICDAAVVGHASIKMKVWVCLAGGICDAAVVGLAARSMGILADALPCMPTLQAKLQTGRPRSRHTARYYRRRADAIATRNKHRRTDSQADTHVYRHSKKVTNKETKKLTNKQRSKKSNQSKKQTNLVNKQTEKQSKKGTMRQLNKQANQSTNKEIKEIKQISKQEKKPTNV